MPESWKPLRCEFVGAVGTMSVSFYTRDSECEKTSIVLRDGVSFIWSLVRREILSYEFQVISFVSHQYVLRINSSLSSLVTDLVYFRSCSVLYHTILKYVWPRTSTIIKVVNFIMGRLGFGNHSLSTYLLDMNVDVLNRLRSIYHVHF